MIWVIMCIVLYILCLIGFGLYARTEKQFKELYKLSRLEVTLYSDLLKRKNKRIEELEKRVRELYNGK